MDFWPSTAQRLADSQFEMKPSFYQYKFDELTNQISKLLGLFETSAKVLAEKDNNASIIDKWNYDETKSIFSKLTQLLCSKICSKETGI